MTSTARHVRKNRAQWDSDSDGYQREHASQLNHWERARWGVWGIPETKLDILGDVDGKDVLELGCGAAQWCIYLARRGARPVGLDLSGRQLHHAGRLMERARVRFPLVNASAEQTPFADASFDLVFCDHGAMSFADPQRTVPEVARILRQGGRFAFNIATALHFMCWNDEKERTDDRLHTEYFGIHRWVGDTVDFQLPFGAWIRLFRRHGLAVEDLVELRPGPRARSTYRDYVDLEWARRWPAENIWVLRKE